MNKNERNDVSNAAKKAGYSQSTESPNKQVHHSGSSVKHIGSNRTNIDGNIYYGPTSAKQAIEKRNK